MKVRRKLLILPPVILVAEANLQQGKTAMKAAVDGVLEVFRALDPE